MTITETKTPASKNKITRRQMLQSAAVASALSITAAAVCAAEEGPRGLLEASENPELVVALQAIGRNRKLLAEIDNDLDWLEAEWRHRWPEAPEEILSIANGDGSHRRPDVVIETDILGRPVRRETVALTKRLSRAFREKNERTCFVLETPDEVRAWIRYAQSKAPRGRTEASREKDRRRIARRLASWESALVPSEQYFAETTRLRELSGVEKMKQRRADAAQALSHAIDDLADAHAYTAGGLRAKAVASISEWSGLLGAWKGAGVIRWGNLLALDVVRATFPRDGVEWSLIIDAFPDTLSQLDLDSAA